MLRDDSRDLTFTGTPKQLETAMERAFTVIPRVKETPDNPVVPVVTSFDRNRGGASETEIKRAAHLVTNVYKVSDAQVQKFSRALDAYTRELTDFLVNEIAPYESALESAIVDAGDTLRLITGLEQADFTFGRARTLMERMSELKLLDWACTRLSLSPDIRTLVLHDYMGIGHEKQPSQKLLELQTLSAVRGSSQERNPRVRAAPARAKRGPSVGVRSSRTTKNS